ncbi:MAG: hypothetical protein LKH88_12705, partial [Acetobacter sp.]|nr:hypothetical protein [Acetobacter sp.]MCI1602415.1 hypothetical protein [Acetobacter sp.]
TKPQLLRAARRSICRNRLVPPDRSFIVHAKRCLAYHPHDGLSLDTGSIPQIFPTNFRAVAVGGIHLVEVVACHCCP